MQPQPAHVLLRRLDALASLSPEERRLLEALPLNAREIGPDQDIVREGDRPTQCLLVLEGFCCRYKSLEDGRRQILSFNIPGDFLDLSGFLLSWLDHSVASLTPVKVAPILHNTLAELTQHLSLARLLWRDTLVDGAVYREWVVNVGRRTAYQRVAHVFCELASRLNVVGLVQDGAFDMPITQRELGDATGLSTVHVNRVIQELRRDKLIELRGRSFTAKNWEHLKRAAGFDPMYLHLQQNSNRNHETLG